MARGTWGIGTRVIAAVVALTAVALALSGLIVATRGHALTEQRVAADLQLAVDEFSTLATQGLDPRTGEPFADAEGLLRVAVQRAVLASDEGVFGVVDGRPRWTAQAAVVFRPDEDAEFAAHVLPLTTLGTVSQGRVTTALRDYRYVVIPVAFGDAAPSGALVRAVDFGAEASLLAEVWRSYVLVALGSMLLTAVLIRALVGRLLAPISWMRRTTERITETDLSGRIQVRGSDDLSALAVTVNGMLDRLEGAVGSQRALLDDVGHELRTPLTIIRGHLEVLDAGDADDVRATRALLLDETDRMGRLIDDLLTLAKAERPELLQPQATDIARLTDETLAKASGLGDRRWTLEELADVELVLDPQRIAQAWLQLAANAVRYSTVGSVVALGSQVRGTELWLWVRDRGTGIGPADRERVLGRFQRGTADGSGAGLGLAIVDAIARAHHGRVEIESEPGQGSCISIVVPARWDAPAEVGQAAGDVERDAPARPGSGPGVEGIERDAAREGQEGP